MYEYFSLALNLLVLTIYPLLCGIFILFHKEYSRHFPERDLAQGQGQGPQYQYLYSDCL